MLCVLDLEHKVSILAWCALKVLNERVYLPIHISTREFKYQTGKGCAIRTCRYLRLCTDPPIDLQLFEDTYSREEPYFTLLSLDWGTKCFGISSNSWLHWKRSVLPVLILYWFMFIIKTIMREIRSARTSILADTFLPTRGLPKKSCFRKPLHQQPRSWFFSTILP